MRRTLHKITIGLLAFLVVSPVIAQEGMPPAQPVEVTRSQMRLIAPVMEVSGSVISVNNSRIASQVEGSLDWIADVGTRVVAGDVIARLDDRVLAINLRRAEANKRRLEADLVNRQQEVDRLQELASRDNASRARFDSAVAARDMVQQQLFDAEAILDQANGDLERASIKAPFTGIVVARLMNVGEYITTGKEVVQLVDTEHVEVVMPAPIAITPYLQAGNEVEVIDANGTTSLPIRVVVGVGDRVSRMVEVRLSAPADKWMIGTPVKVNLPSAPARNVVAVERDALVLRGSTFFIYVINEQNTADMIPVNINDASGAWVAVPSLPEGAAVIMRGAERLPPGMPVVISNE